MLVATLSLTNCSKEIEASIDEENAIAKEVVPFELFANPGETKTAITGFAPRWTANDPIGVFHAVNGSSTYYNDGEFTIASEDLATGRFTGTLDGEHLPASGNTYDWYLIYPYNSYLTTPAAKDGRYYIGKRSDQAQVQTGNSTTNHLSGTNFPLYGVSKNVAYNEIPSVTLSNIASVIEVKVTNKNTAPLTVTSVSVTAPSGTSIVGQYTIDFTTDPMTFTDYSTYTSETANLTVSGGSPLAKNEYATFYIGVKPFDIEADGEHKKDLKISVNGYEKTISLAKNVSFAPGKIKTINFAYDEDPVIYSTAFNYSAVGSSYQSSDVYEGTDAGGQTSWGITYGNWNGGNCAQFRVYKTGGGFGTLVQQFDCSNVKYVTYDAVASATGLTLTPYYSTDKGANWTAVSADAKSITTTKTNYKFTVSETGAYGRVRVKLVVSGDRPDSGNNPLTIDDLKIYGEGAVLSDPYITAADISGIAAVGVTDEDATYTINHFSGADDVTAACDGTIVTAASVDNAGGITFTVAPNYTSSSRNGTITLSSPRDLCSKEIKVTQLASSLSTSTLIVTIPNDTETATFTVTSPEFGWVASATAASEKNLSVDVPTSGDATASATITVRSTTAAAASIQELGTVKIYRSGTTALTDPQVKEVVIRKASSAATKYFRKVNSITSGKQYLIVQGNGSKALVPSVTGGKKGATSVVIDGDNKIESSSYTSYVVTITENGGNYNITFVDSEETYYLVYNSSTNLSASTNTTKKWTVQTTAATGKPDIKGTFRFVDSSNNDRGLVFNGTQWGGYAVSNVDGSSYWDLDLYKLDD